MSAVENWAEIQTQIRHAEEESRRAAGSVTLIAVSKTFPVEDIRPVLEAGHRIFGENRVQEAQAKFPILRGDVPDLELHLIGPLQSNKAKEAVQLFDVIHTIDRDKIARAIADEIQRQGKHPKLLVQVNTGEEEQKAGIAPKDALAFVARCQSEFSLTISGLMCIPPVDENPAPHFALLDELAKEAGLPYRSMGMSSDFEMAVRQGATHVRVGSAIFGKRDYPTGS